MTNPEASDNRRATAIVCHFGRLNVEGVNAILTEATEAKRVVALLISVLELHKSIVPILLTADGLACVTPLIYSFLHTDDQDCSRAARLIASHSEDDAAAFTAVVDEAGADNRVSETIASVLGIFRASVPMLYSEIGLQVLERSIIDWAAREDEDDTE